jgi:hypothetical protein
MTIQVLHDILPIGEDTKIVFVSFRGELTQQFKINRMLIQEGDLTPTAFSHSVFNTPPALGAIALNLRAGYSAVYPGDNRFDVGFLAAAAPILSGAAGEVVLVYADELGPPEYGGLLPAGNRPFAFAALLSADPAGAVPSPVGDALKSPENFLQYLYQI